MQVDASDVSPQYTLATNGRNIGSATLSTAGNTPTLYLTTSDYVTYRDYYSVASTPTTASNAPTTIAVSADQYQTVRQQLATVGTVLATSADGTTTISTNGSTGDAHSPGFLDRYLRQTNGDLGDGQHHSQSAGTTTVVVNGSQYKNGLSVDLPSPDSGIGEATITPRGENGQLPQVNFGFLSNFASSFSVFLRVFIFALRIEVVAFRSSLLNFPQSY